MRKKIVSLITVVTLLAGMLVGCGGSGTGPASKKEGAAKLTGEKIKVTAQLHGWGKDWLDNAAAEFTYQTGIEVNVEWDALLSSSLVTILENEETINSDIYFANNVAYETYLKAGWIEDLTDFMNEPDDAEGGKSLNERMDEGIYRYILKEDGSKVQGIVPITNSNFGMVYNIKIMNYLCHDVLGWEEGHDYPVNSKELFEVIEALEAETAAGKNKELLTYVQDGKTYDVKPLVWSGVTGSLEFLFKPWFAQYIGQDKLDAYLAETGDEPTILKDTANFICYQKICDLMGVTEDNNGNVYPENSIPNCVSYNHTSSQSHFFLGKALLMPGASWIYKEMESMIENVEDWGYMPVPYLSDEEGNPLTAEGVEMPKNEDGTYKHYSSSHGDAGDCAIIPMKSENKEISKKFLRFITSSEYLPNLADDMQSCLAYKCDYSKMKNSTYWFKQVLNVHDSAVIANWFSTNIMVKKGGMSFYKTTEVPPFTQFSLGTYGSVTKMVDSATGEELKEGEQAKGYAVSENVYKYVDTNFKAALVSWHKIKASVGGLN